MDLVEIEQHKLIVEKGKELLNVALYKDFDYLKSMIEFSKSIIDYYNNTNITVEDISNKENGIWNSIIKHIVCGHFYNPIINKMPEQVDRTDDIEYICKDHFLLYTYEDGTEEWLYDTDKFCKSCKKELLKRQKEYFDFIDEKDKIRDEFKKACDITVFCDDLKAKCILLIRKKTSSSDSDPLFLAIKNAIRTEILSTFQNQNKKLINKYL